MTAARVNFAACGAYRISEQTSRFRQHHADCSHTIEVERIVIFKNGHRCEMRYLQLTFCIFAGHNTRRPKLKSQNK